jgi:hypothetical protein
MTTTFYYISFPICRPGGGQYGGYAGVFFRYIYLKAGSAGKRRLFPAVSFYAKNREK